MKTFVYNNQKFTPATLKKLNIVFIGTDAECNEYAKKLEKENNNKYDFYVSSFSWYKLTSRKTLEMRPQYTSCFDKDNCFVMCWDEA